MLKWQDTELGQGTYQDMEAEGTPMFKLDYMYDAFILYSGFILRFDLSLELIDSKKLRRVACVQHNVCMWESFWRKRFSSFCKESSSVSRNFW